jgi:uncharacterized delta-60 repeat protein
MAQTGAIDTSFNSLDSGYSYLNGPNNSINNMALQHDGKILISGLFTSYNKKPCNGFSRINTDGTFDTTFNIGSGPNDWVSSICPQVDGKIILSGDFTSFNGFPANRFIRLNTDGTIDASFNSGASVNQNIYEAILQPDGKIIICGNFTTYNGAPINLIARINSNGSLDSTFVTDIGTNGIINKVFIQPDSSIIIIGNFSFINGSSNNKIARINPDGTLDSTLIIGSGADSIYAVAVQMDGKIILGGRFSSFNGTNTKNLIRLFPDGTIDTTFDIGPWIYYNILDIALQPDGKIIIGGNFQIQFGASSDNISRLNPDGSFDSNFNNGNLSAGGTVFRILLQTDLKILLAGPFTNYGIFDVNRIARLNTDGTFDPLFNPVSGANSWVIGSAVQSDEKILIGGAFTTYNGVLVNHISRLYSNGNIDTAFNVGAGANNTVSNFSIQQDGKIVVSGDFDKFDNYIRNKIVRLNSDGSVDTTFNPGTGANSWIRTTLVQPDGKILIGGNFTIYNGVNRNYIARINSDGSLDTTFNPGAGTNMSVRTLSQQPNGKIIIGGDFNYVNGIPRNFLAQLNTDGSLDTTFDIGSGADFSVYTTKIDPDGKILVGGGFHAFNGNSSQYIVRLNSDGSIDTTFNKNGQGANNEIYGVSILANGKIIIAGAFNYYNGGFANNIARLYHDGYMDLTFSSGNGGGPIFTLALQSNQSIIIGGQFYHYNYVGRNRLARILNDTLSISISEIKKEIIQKLNLAYSSGSKILYVDAKNLKGKSYSLNLIDINGKALYIEKGNLYSDYFSKSINVSNLSSGLFIINIVTDLEIRSNKFIHE